MPPRQVFITDGILTCKKHRSSISVAATFPKYWELGTDTGDYGLPGGAPIATERVAGQARQYGQNDLWGDPNRRRIPKGYLYPEGINDL
ncbi:MAG: hypothetical protein ABL933_06600 [Methyloglobulus sp.]